MGVQNRVLGAKKGSFPSAGTLALGALLLVLLTMLGAGRMFGGFDIIQSKYEYYQTSVPTAEAEVRATSETVVDMDQELVGDETNTIGGTTLKSFDYSSRYSKDVIFVRHTSTRASDLHFGMTLCRRS